MDSLDIAPEALQILSPVLAAALAWLSAKLAALIRSKTDNAHLQGVLLRLDDAIFTAIKELQITVVDEAKALAADGKLSPAERQQVRSAAIANVKSHLGPKGLSEVRDVLGLTSASAESFLMSKVEAAVHDLRQAEVRLKAMNGVPPPFGPTPAP